MHRIVLNREREEKMEEKAATTSRKQTSSFSGIQNISEALLYKRSLEFSEVYEKPII